MNFGTFLSGPAKRTVGAKDSCEKTTALVVAETALYIAICGGGTVITLVTGAPIAFIAALVAVYYLRD